ncbi:MAG TPA: STAS domain-containing protein [Paracoccaceae bacterium]|nr:STAS domain-containing protein [Paracoccaceae bacterium]
MPRHYRLPDRIDRSGARRVMQAILGAQGHDLALDAADVRMIGTPGVQVLLAAARQWSMDGRCLTVDPVSDDLAAVLGRLGLSVDHLVAGGAA